jgi:hypothetical protein
LNPNYENIHRTVRADDQPQQKQKPEASHPLENHPFSHYHDTGNWRSNLLHVALCGMTETTTTAMKSAVTTDVMTGFAGLMTARLAGRETLQTAFGMRTLTKKQQSKKTENDNTRKN